MQLEVMPNKSLVMQPIAHSICDFGIEARRAGKSWETAFNGPIHIWCDEHTGESKVTITVRLCRIKDPVTRELYSTNLIFRATSQQARGMLNVYDMVHEMPFTRITGPRKAIPVCAPREDALWYEPNPEGVIMEDLRQVPMVLDNGEQGFFVTGQGYRGKVMLPSGKFIHDVGVYGGYLDLSQQPNTVELKHLFGGIEFGAVHTGTQEDGFLTELAQDVWVRGIVGNASHELHVESFKNSVLLPDPGDGRHLIGARSMSETKLLYFFETNAEDRLSGYRLGGFVEGLSKCLGVELWERVHRVGLGSNFIECPELGGYVGFIHIVLDKNNPNYPDTRDIEYPEIEEQYEGWAVLLRYDQGHPVIHSCVRAITPDDIPGSYEGLGELFDIKRVAFPISATHMGRDIAVAYGWGDRALFLSAFHPTDIIQALRDHMWE